MALLDYNDINKANLYADLINDKNDLEYFYLKAEIMINEGKIEEADNYLEINTKKLMMTKKTILPLTQQLYT